VTGNVLRMPYQIHETTYAMAPVFLWQAPRPEPVYHHNVMRHGHMDDLRWYMEKRVAAVRWIFYHWSHGRMRYLPYPLVLIVLLGVLAWILRDRWSRFALLTCGVLTAGLIMETWVFMHYAAPIIGLVFALMLQAMRHLRLWRWRGRQTGRFMVWTISMICLVSFVMAFAQQMRANWSAQVPPRARILAQLQEAEGRHLVIVRYGPSHQLNEDWVYNEADIDGAKVVWAREMDSAQNRKLLEYFKDRYVWLVEVGKDHSSPQLASYPVESGM
jgi:hypothetical protein